jgi:hypothetical protein
LQEFLRPAKAREFVAVERIEADPARLDGVDEFFLLLRRGLLQVTVDRPEDLNIPLKLRPGRVVGGLLRRLNRLLVVPPVCLLDVGLHVRVTDIDVGVRQDIDDPFADGFQPNLFRRERLAIGFHGDSNGRFLFDRCDGNVDGLLAVTQRGLDRFAARDAHERLALRAHVPHGHMDHLAHLAGLFDQHRRRFQVAEGR